MGKWIAKGLVVVALLFTGPSSVHPSHPPVASPPPPTLASKIHTATVNLREQACLAYNILFEAGNQPALGQIAVAWVVLNRVKSTQWPDTVCSVIREPHQFAWLDNSRHRRWFESLTFPARYASGYIRAWVEAGKVLRGAIPDPTDGATFYHTLAIHPTWAYTMEETVVIGQHVFYRLKSTS